MFLTQILSNIEMALVSLVSNKTRALLTMLGIIIGVGSVITMNAIGEGASEAIAGRIGSMGVNMLQIDPAAVRLGGVSSGAGGASQKMTEEDLTALRKCKLLVNIAPSVDTRIQVVAGNSNWATRLTGTTAEGLEIRAYKLASGTMISDADSRSGRKVCILGKTVADNLFGPGVDPVGRGVRIKSLPFVVIGELESKGANANGFDQDDVIFGPLGTVQKKIMGIAWLDDIFTSTASASDAPEAIAEITAILRQQHRIQPSQPDDFRIRSQVEIAEAANASAKTMTNLLSSAAIISLLVGGIGIMNIMLVTVTERTREIGIRKSIGAKSFDILLQFLTEAVVLSLLGGIIGVMLGYAASALVSDQNGWKLSISMVSVLTSFGAATAVGVFFGWYPAQKAARLDPIDSLRYD